MPRRSAPRALLPLLLTLAAPLAAADPERAAVDWSESELAYLRSRGPIRMCVAPDWMPVEGIDPEGRHTGIAGDYLRLMARKGGLEIELVPATSWEESWALGERRRCDIFSLLMDSPSRRTLLDFTTPYLEIPGVIATSVNVPFVADLDQLAGERLGHMRGFAGVELLRLEHPGIELVEVESYEEGIARVQRGEIFGLIGNMLSVGRVLQENKISDVKIAGRIGHDNRMSVATRNDEPELRAIFQKLVDAIEPAERQAIANRWFAVRFEQGFDYRRFWQVVGVLGLLGAVTFYWATKLRKLNAELRKANARLAEISRHDALTGLHNRLHFDEILAPSASLCARNRITLTLAVIDLDRFKAVNDAFGHPFGDACLRRVAALLRSSFRRDTDTAIRYGGEELVVVSVGGSTGDAVERLEAFRRDVERSPVAHEGREAFLTVSLGVWSGIPEIQDDPAALLERADAALYRAKERGRNRLEMATAEVRRAPAALAGSAAQRGT